MARKEFTKETGREQECSKPRRIRREILGGRTQRGSHVRASLVLLVGWAALKWKNFVYVC